MKIAKIRIWNDNLLVDYVNEHGIDSSFVIKDEQDIKDLKEELLKMS